MAEEEPPEVSVARSLDRHRHALKIPQADLARAVGVSQSQLSKMLRGARPFTLGQYLRACGALGVSPASLIEEQS